MADYAQTLEEEMAASGNNGYYSLKSNRFFVKENGVYRSADVSMDTTVSEVAQEVTEVGEEMVEDIETLAAAEKDLIHRSEQDYRKVKASLIQTYTRLYNYFQYEQLTGLRDMIGTAMNDLNALD